MVDFGGAIKVTRQELLKQVQCIVELLEYANNEEILFNIVHGFFETLLKGRLGDTARLTGKGVATKELNIFPSNVNTLRILLLHTLVNCLNVNEINDECMLL